VLELIVGDLIKSDKKLEGLVKKLSSLASAITRSPKRRNALARMCRELDINIKEPIKYCKVR